MLYLLPLTWVFWFDYLIHIKLHKHANCGVNTVLNKNLIIIPYLLIDSNKIVKILTKFDFKVIYAPFNCFPILTYFLRAAIFCSSWIYSCYGHLVFLAYIIVYLIYLILLKCLLIIGTTLFIIHICLYQLSFLMRNYFFKYISFKKVMKVRFL